MRGHKSVLLFNIGIHYSISLNFTIYQRLIDSVIKMLRQGTGTKDKERELKSQAYFIWRSTTAIEGENFGANFWGDNLTEWRFHTNPVRRQVQVLTYLLKLIIMVCNQINLIMANEL